MRSRPCRVLTQDARLTANAVAMATHQVVEQSEYIGGGLVDRADDDG